MRRAYLYDQPVKDAEHMGVGDEWFLDTASTKRQALADLVDTKVLRPGDVLVVSAKSKLGKGLAAQRIIDKIAELGAQLEVCPVPDAQPKQRGKRRKITEKEKKYCRALWQSVGEPSDAIKAISKYLGFDVDRNWCNYNLGLRGS